MRGRFDKLNWFIEVYDGTRYLVLFDSEKCDAISHNYTRIKVDSYDPLPLEKTLTFHNVIIHVVSVWNKDQNRYCYSKFLEKWSYELDKINGIKSFP